MDDNHEITHPPAALVRVVCADCWRLGRKSAVVAIGVRRATGWTLLDASRRTYLANARRFFCEESNRQVEDGQVPAGKRVTDTQAPMPIVYRPGSAGANPDRLSFKCRNADCRRHVEGVRTRRFMNRLESPRAIASGVVEF